MRSKTCNSHKTVFNGALLGILLLGWPIAGHSQQAEPGEPEESDDTEQVLGKDAFENVLLPTAWQFTGAVLQGNWEEAQAHYLVTLPEEGSEIAPSPLAEKVREIYQQRHRHYGGEKPRFQIFSAQSVQVVGFGGGWVVPILFPSEKGDSLAYDLWVNTREGWRVIPMQAIGRENLLVSLPPEITVEELVPREDVEAIGDSLKNIQERGRALGEQLLDSLEKLQEP